MSIIGLHLASLRLRCLMRRGHSPVDGTDPVSCARCGGTVRGWTLVVTDRFDVFADEPCD